MEGFFLAGFSWRAFLGGLFLAILATLREMLFGSGPVRRYNAREARLAEQPQGGFHAKTPSRKEVLSDSLASLRETGTPRRSEAEPR